jgi:hypothetical protein
MFDPPDEPGLAPPYRKALQLYTTFNDKASIIMVFKVGFPLSLFDSYYTVKPSG